MRFIILDKDDILKDTLFTYIEAKGHSCERVSKEEEALTLINKEHVDIVVVESSLLNGYNLLKVIQEKKPQTKVILMKDTANKKNHGNAVVHEAYNPYPQPFDSQKLLEALEEVKKIIGINY